MLLGGLVGEYYTMNQLLMRVADWHERVDFIISGHEYLLDLLDAEGVAFVLELVL